LKVDLSLMLAFDGLQHLLGIDASLLEFSLQHEQNVVDSYGMAEESDAALAMSWPSGWM
jgi:hypothetical protein